MQNRVVVFTFSFLFFFLFFFLCGKIFFVPNAEFSGGVHIFCFKLEARCLFKFGSKIQHYLFKWNFGSQTNLIMQNSLAVFTFPDIHGKDHFQANLDKKKVEIVSFVPRLVRIWRIQWCSSLFLFQMGNTLFWQIQSKKW